MVQVRKESFTGTLSIWDIDCTFSFFDEVYLEIKPIPSLIETFQEKCKEFRGNFDGMDWINGISTERQNVAFHPADYQGPLSYVKETLTLIIDVFLRDYANADGDKGETHDLCGFNAIDFCGDAVDAVFSPRCVLKSGCRGNRIEWKETTECAKAFVTHVVGRACSLIFTVYVDRKDTDCDSTELGTLHSILRLEFDQRQSISAIEDCRQIVCYFLAFCTGHLNVSNLQISLWDTGKRVGIFNWPGMIDCRVNSEEDDNIQFCGTPYNRLQIDWLGDKTGQLFELIGDENSRPVLSFLPKKNAERLINRNKIRDLCTALEVEYDARKAEFPDSTEEIVRILKETVKKYKKENPDALDERIYSYVHGTLDHISLPASEKAWRIYARYSSIIAEGYKQYFYDKPINLSEPETQKNIAWIIKVRNNITHSSGVQEQLIPNAIYTRLRIALYCSVLERSGYSIPEIEFIMQSYFTGRSQ